MIIRRKRWFFVTLASLLVLGGCVAQPQVEKTEDTRLDQLLAQLDQSLANQATARTQLQEQQRQLQLQQQNLEALNANIGKALKAPPEASQCPEAVTCPSLPETSSKMTVGGLEEVWFPDLDLALTARIDTGVATASLDARDIEQFERDGKPWVRFTIMNPTAETPKTLERRLVRTIGIHQAGSADAKRRPVVKMGIVIGQSEQTAEFSLSNRRHSGYQVKIGRSILKDVMVVDVSKKNMAPYVLSEKAPDKAPKKAGAAK